ncbi:MAG: ABC transporter permease [Nitrospirae bacterium]|jgi:ABC-type polysaccharide/polyol phosphate export permease|nr:ABC transporter permease [Nitrospirota bacterium]
MNGFKNEIKEIVRYNGLLHNLIIRDIKVRYKRSMLGFFWVMLHPLLIMLILNVMFSKVFNIGKGSYSVYILSGIIIWNFFSQGTTNAMDSFRTNNELIRKVYFPRAVLPISVITSSLIHFVFSLVPLFIIIVLTNTPISSKIIILPITIVPVLLFALGISLIISVLNVYFHDTRYIYEVLIMAWMYATPIFYPASIVSGKLEIIIRLNPFYYFLDSFRTALYLDNPLFITHLIFGFLFAVFAFIFGLLIYAKNKDKIVYYL